MLEFSETVLTTIRRLEKQTGDMLLSGSVRDMEQYKFLMGRLEGFRFVEAAIKELLNKDSKQ